jgi:hypothetical protein
MSAMGAAQRAPGALAADFRPAPSISAMSAALAEAPPVAAEVAGAVWRLDAAYHLQGIVA